MLLFMDKYTLECINIHAYIPLDIWEISELKLYQEACQLLYLFEDCVKDKESLFETTLWFIVVKKQIPTVLLNSYSDLACFF